VGEISRNWQTPGSYVKPRMQLHAAHYRLDTGLMDGSQSASRVVPTVSVDSGLVFERSASYFGRNLTQTLEPRAFFSWTPQRDQSLLPNYDSAANDFNFASIYTENAFGGNDRISDTRALTVGASSRLLDPKPAPKWCVWALRSAICCATRPWCSPMPLACRVATRCWSA
jgi:LPS-assembly protein